MNQGRTINLYPPLSLVEKTYQIFKGIDQTFELAMAEASSLASSRPSEIEGACFFDKGRGYRKRKTKAMLQEAGEDDDQPYRYICEIDDSLDVGRYNVTIANGPSVTENFVHLTVHEPPKISQVDPKAVFLSKSSSENTFEFTIEGDFSVMRDLDDSNSRFAISLEDESDMTS